MWLALCPSTFDLLVTAPVTHLQLGELECNFQSRDERDLTHNLQLAVLCSNQSVFMPP